MFFESQTADAVLSIALEGDKATAVLMKKNKEELEMSSFLEAPIENVNLLYTSEQRKELAVWAKEALIATHVSAEQLLTRRIILNLKKKKDVLAALPFQLEPLLPFSLEQTLYAVVEWEKKQEKTQLVIAASKKEQVKKSIDICEALFSPEVVGAIPVALLHFAKEFIEGGKEDSYIVLYLSDTSSEVLGIKVVEGHLNAALSSKKNHLQEACLEKVTLALLQEEELPNCSLCVVGSKDSLSLEKKLCEKLLLSSVSFSKSYKEKELLYRSKALALGLGLSFLTGSKKVVNLRQKELSYPFPFRRLKRFIAQFFLATTLCAAALFFATESWKAKEIARLNVIFKALYKEKNVDSLSFLEKIEREEKLADKRTSYYALIPHTPRVSDVLMWLATHEPLSSISIENFSYKMVKRPDPLNKKEKYKVRVELEFSSPSARDARAFHEALLIPNDFLDPKTEVFWQLDRGIYRVAFFLKDKTRYPKT
jgi:type IV pilus assembly protein PilM